MQFDQLRRREFITLLGGAAAVWPLAAGGQQPERMRRMGVLMPNAADDAQFDRDIAALLEARLFEPAAKRSQKGFEFVGGGRVDEPDDRQRPVLRARRERPRGGRAAEELNELSPLHFADPKPKDYARELPPLSARLN